MLWFRCNFDVQAISVFKTKANKATEQQKQEQKEKEEKERNAKKQQVAQKSKKNRSKKDNYATLLVKAEEAITQAKAERKKKQQKQQEEEVAASSTGVMTLKQYQAAVRKMHEQHQDEENKWAWTSIS